MEGPTTNEDREPLYCNEWIKDPLGQPWTLRNKDPRMATLVNERTVADKAYIGRPQQQMVHQSRTERDTQRLSRSTQRTSTK
jgi:hypothetical protein